MWLELTVREGSLIAQHDTDGEQHYTQGSQLGNNLAPADVEVIDQGNGVGLVRPLREQTGPAPARLIVNYIRAERERGASVSEWQARYEYNRVGR